ncbi:hypothetical protein GCM10010413_11390 [Promicromonospora sukumoe]|uniref:Uncharacterized protein n=1 Tax=Promicromonospora sukumoe TaxID=88382 RepID=A0A7W3PCJ7_9MICO|nr:hypothetical protein [Promicromonospora sukumoe]MBA8806803.1 hypothetical protein [Promicromonospora sukumoe]
MTRYDHTPEPADDGWLTHLREVGGGVVPPTPADPHDLARVAVRRTRTRRAFLASGAGLTAVAAFAGAAFALGGPTTAGVLLPGGSASVSASASPDPSATASSAADPDPATELAAGEVPDGWHTHELAGLTYSLPPEIVTSGPVQDEPGVISDMWHSSVDPDSPPFLRMAYHEEGPEDLPGIVYQVDGEPFDLPGAERAEVFDVAAEVYGLPPGTEVPDDQKGPTMLVLEPASGEGAYMINLNLPHESAADFVATFKATLSLD